MADDVRTLVLQFQAQTEVARAELSKLVGTLGTTASDVDARLGQIESGFDKLNDGIGNNMQLMSAKVHVLATAIGTALGTLVAQLPGELAQLTQRAIDTAGSIKNTADALGVSTDALQDFRLGTAKAGATTEQADAALAKFQETTGKAASGNKAALASFEALGVSIKDSNGNLLPFDELLRKVADGLERQPDPARQAAAAIKIFGSNGDAILPFLRSGAAGIDAMAEAAESLGLKLTPATINRLDELGSKADEVKKILSVQMAAAIGENADAFLALGAAAQSAISGIAGVVSQIRGIKLLVSRGDAMSLFGMSGGELAALGTAKGRMDYANQKLVAAQKSGRPETVLDAEKFRAEMTDAYLNEAFPLKSPKTPGKAGGKVEDPGATVSSAKAAKPGKREFTPAELRAGLDRVDAALPINTQGPLADLESISKQLDTIQTQAVDLSNVDILDPNALKFGLSLMEDASYSLTSLIAGAGKVGDTLVDTFSRAGLAMLQSGILNFLSGGKEGTSFSSAFSSIGKLFGGARAGGGPVDAGTAYWVGEKGPELVVPRADGFVVPNHRLGGGGAGGGGTVTHNYNLTGNILTEELFSHINAKASAAAQAGALTGRALARQDTIRRARRQLG